jgi:hypothetical protein
MTLVHLHDDFAAPAGKSRFTLARASAWLVAALKTIHQAIVTAKTRRLQRELMLHADLGDAWPGEDLGERDVRKIPQRPMILGDKWDF